MKRSIGKKQCKKCGQTFETDLRGGAKWCFPCKTIVNRESRRQYRRRETGQEYAAS